MLVSALLNYVNGFFTESKVLIERYHDAFDTEKNGNKNRQSY